MAFCSQKPAAVSAVMSAYIGYLFLFASGVGFPLSVGRTEVRLASLRMAILTSVASTAGLMMNENPMN